MSRAKIRVGSVIGREARGAGRILMTATNSFIGHGFYCRNRNYVDHSRRVFIALNRQSGFSLSGRKTCALAPVFNGFYFSRMKEVPHFCLLQLKPIGKARRVIAGAGAGPC